MAQFPSPPEVTGGSYQLSGENDNPQNLLFPPPSEVNGGSYTNELPKTGEVSKFPYPLEVNGLSYRTDIDC